MLVANTCVWLGLIIITFIDARTLWEHGPEPVLLYNPDKFVLFLGAIIVCFEGIGLVLPVRASLEPHLQVCSYLSLSFCTQSLPFIVSLGLVLHAF